VKTIPTRRRRWVRFVCWGMTALSLLVVAGVIALTVVVVNAMASAAALALTAMMEQIAAVAMVIAYVATLLMALAVVLLLQTPLPSFPFVASARLIGVLIELWANVMR
jgi:hypothetical protein